MDVLSHFWAPLCAVGSAGPRGPNAQICVSVFGASIVPERPRLLVVLSRSNYTEALVRESGVLSVTLLGREQLDLLEALGLRSGRDGNKLAGLKYELDARGCPRFPGGAGWAGGEVLDLADFGDSTGFLVAVRERETWEPPPLSWQEARSNVDGRFLARWAEKSAREQELARARMLWLGGEGALGDGPEV